MDFVLEVVLAKFNQLFCGVNIVNTIFCGLFQLLLSERAVNVKRYSRLLDRKTQVTFDSLEGQAHLHIVFDVHVVETEEKVSKHWTLPTLTSADNEIVHLFDFLRCEPTANRLDDELIIVLSIERNIDGIVIDTFLKFFVIVMDNGVLLGFYVLENDQPVMGETLYVIHNQSHNESPFLSWYPMGCLFNCCS